MTAKHKEAIPANPIIRVEYPVLSPKEAQQLYPEIIGDNKDFICAAHKECEAPLTCRCLSKKNKTAVFVEGSVKENMHHPECPFSDDNEEKPSLKTSYQNKEQQFVDVYTGEDVLYLYGNTYKKNKKSVSSIKGKKEDEEDSKQQFTTTSSLDRSLLPSRKRQTRYEFLRKQVALFESNPEHKVMDNMTGKTIRIKDVFLPMESNDLSENIDSWRTLIYFGTAFINEPKIEGKDFNIRFSETLELNNIKGKPTFFINKETLYDKFPVIMEKWEEDKNQLVNAYIRAHFYIKNGFINFDIDKEILPEHFLLTLRK